MERELSLFDVIQEEEEGIDYSENSRQYFELLTVQQLREVELLITGDIRALSKEGKERLIREIKNKKHNVIYPFRIMYDEENRTNKYTGLWEENALNYLVTSHPSMNLVGKIFTFLTGYPYSTLSAKILIQEIIEWNTIRPAPFSVITSNEAISKYNAGIEKQISSAKTFLTPQPKHRTTKEITTLTEPRLKRTTYDEPYTSIPFTLEPSFESFSLREKVGDNWYKIHANLTSHGRHTNILEKSINETGKTKNALADSPYSQIMFLPQNVLTTTIGPQPYNVKWILEYLYYSIAEDKKKNYRVATKAVTDLTSHQPEMYQKYFKEKKLFSGITVERKEWKNQLYNPKMKFQGERTAQLFLSKNSNTAMGILSTLTGSLFVAEEFELFSSHLLFGEKDEILSGRLDFLYIDKEGNLCIADVKAPAPFSHIWSEKNQSNLNTVYALDNPYPGHMQQVELYAIMFDFLAKFYKVPLKIASTAILYYYPEDTDVGDKGFTKMFTIPRNVEILRTDNQKTDILGKIHQSKN